VNSFMLILIFYLLFMLILVAQAEFALMSCWPLKSKVDYAIVKTDGMHGLKLQILSEVI